MKALLAGIVLILVLGIGAFFYHNVLTHQPSPTASSTQPVACTDEAKVCPDGTSVGRTGPNCAFAACPAPNVSLDAIHIAFVLPAGYTENAQALGQDATLIAAYEKASKTPNAPHAIVVRDYPIPAGKTANDVMISNTMHESSGAPVQSMSEFKQEIISGHTYYMLTVERFEGQVHTVYYLPRANDVLRFEVLEKDVDWTNPNLVIESLPEHKALLALLTSLQTQ